MTDPISASAGGLQVAIQITDDGIPLLVHLGTTAWDGKMPAMASAYRLVEVHGENPAGMYRSAIGSKRISSLPGLDCRYRSHRVDITDRGPQVTVELGTDELAVQWQAQLFTAAPVMQVRVQVTNLRKNSQLVTGIASFHYCGLGKGGTEPWHATGRLHECAMTWCGELQWRSRNAREVGLWPPRKNADTSFRHLVRNVGSWSSSEHLPMAIWERCDGGDSLVWQIEHQGSWSWEIGDRGGDAYLYCSGPDEDESHWFQHLKPGESFTTVPVAVGVVAPGTLPVFDEACRAMTRYRRAMRRPHQDLERLPVMFNDYMNCLFADPTTAKEIPLIAAAAAAGCETYVVDAGWYDDGPWWSKIGVWEPALTRFGDEGITGLLDRIRAAGMAPGLWLELEAMGVDCPLAKTWPAECFYRRHGRPAVSRGRYLLDFRHPIVLAHADAVIDRLVGWGVGYIKMDFNNEIGIGTEVDAKAPGAGMLDAQRAYLAWLDRVFNRHPDLVIENCASGGMRMDYALLARHQIQSISDEEDYRNMAIIAANGASAVAPEQQAVWSYPLRDGDLEETRMNMVNAMLLRIHQSGHLADLAPERLAAVQEGIACYRAFRHHLRDGLPFWPLGTAHFGDSWAASAIEDDDTILIAVWHLSGDTPTMQVPIPQWIGFQASATCCYPAGAAPCMWQVAAGSLVVELPASPTARIFSLKRRR